MKNLTQEVFNLPECPDWAKSAAVDSSGDAYYYETEKRYLRKSLFSYDVSYSTDKAQYIGSNYDTTDWQESAISRERV